MERFRRSGLDDTSIILLIVVSFLAVLHHTDHVLRVDHSGWPFRPMVTPFTFSLLAYPIVIFALYGSRSLFWWRWTGVAVATVFTLFAHFAIETPRMQFTMWARDQSLDSRTGAGIHNLPDVHSTSIAVVSVGISMALNIAVVSGTISMFLQGLKLHRAGKLATPR